MPVPTQADLRAMMNLVPEQAIAYLERKGFAITWQWHDADAATHARSFTVARAMRLDILQDIRNALTDNLKAGKTLRDFQKDLTPVLQAKGWWGKQIITDADGNAENVQLGSPRRLATIYQTNLQSAYMAGRYSAALEATDTHPYWMYIAINDGRTRPSHRALHGKVWRWDDPIWRTIIPPNGFNCRCRFIALTDAEVKRRGLTVQNSDGKLSTKKVEMGVNPRTGEVRETDVTVVQTTDAAGRLVQFSPDPGFSGGPGQSHSLDELLMAKARRTLGDTAAVAEVQTVLLDPIRQNAWTAFVDNAARFSVYIDKLKRGRVVDQNQTMAVGVLAMAELEALQAVGITPHSGVIVMRDTLLVGPKAQRHQAAGNALTTREWKQLPQLLATADLVLLQADNHNIVYVIDIGGGEVIKVAVRADRVAHAKLGLDDVATAFKVPRENIGQSVQAGFYTVVRGAGFEPDNMSP